MTRPSFIIDASIILAWYNPEEENSYADDILSCLNEEIAITPQLCCLEINNVMRTFEKKGKISSFDTERAIASINDLPIKLDNRPVNFENPFMMSLARKYDLTIYDACYLELAARLNLPIATLDKKLIEAAKQAGVQIKLQNLLPV
ncbi:MAG: type II toxin-antitoxin system VapC family toxin [Synergistaceae bacterium]|nr:type II toxin-antitoxin system VapC family toxin [Synergistaceae bacterium]